MKKINTDVKKISLDMDMSGEKRAGKKIEAGLSSVGTIKTNSGNVNMKGLLKSHGKENFNLNLS